MELPDPSTSHAVLIGASRYDTALEPLPGVRNNLVRLAQILADPQLCGLPQDHIHVLSDPRSPSEVLRALNSAARQATDTLIVYFAGHGLRDPDTLELYLALPAADAETLHEALRYDDVRRAVVRTSRAAKRVVLLDCCFSGAAMIGGMSGATVELADEARLGVEDGEDIDSTYLMTASAPTALALADPAEQYTAFTGELIEAVSGGIASAPGLLDTGSLFSDVRRRLIANRRPRPQGRAQNNGRAIVLVRNRLAVADDPAPDAGKDANRGAGAQNAVPRRLHGHVRNRSPEHLLRGAPRWRNTHLARTKAD
jgi:hypothetical protein